MLSNSEVIDSIAEAMYDAYWEGTSRWVPFQDAAPDVQEVWRRLANLAVDLHTKVTQTNLNDDTDDPWYKQIYRQGWEG